MSEEYVPQVGDRVRVVIEGEVESSGSAGFTIEPGYRIYNDEVQVVSVEKVAPPLPTTPGSVIISTNGEFLAHLSLSGRWVSDGGNHIEPEPGYWKPFDAGQVTP